MTGRAFFVWLHRWAGLAMAGFLVVVGLTGSLLAFNMELERVFAPQLFAKARPGADILGLATLAERGEPLVPRGRLVSVSYTQPDQARLWFEPRDDPATGKPYDLGFTDFFVDPWTGAELGRRRNADLSEGWINAMPFIYDLHWRLALGDLGQWTLGILALVWTIDCFVAFYLTLPQSTAGFWGKWRPAWTVKRNARFFRLNFDLHRASGLWLWALLLVFAWSSVMMDMRRPVYEWVMSSLFDFKSRIDDFDLLPKREPHKPGLGWRAAEEAGRRLLGEQGAKRGFAVLQPLNLTYFHDTNVYFYEARGSRDVVDPARYGGGASVIYDGDTGELIALAESSGQRLGNLVENWLYALHMGQVFGLPYRILVCILGLAVALLSFTGVYIWWKKRSARVASRKRSSAPALRPRQRSSSPLEPGA
jgi:uncharacterized iron-regulated membrane protein